ncbi:MAG TPA: 16S rRNA (cytosine(1402)-N(4))-methyltransferase RsmH [Candidatus Saccharimonadales bacterium]|nr:16S rRNA (cytosine(1402)-N(4))-methyltransferase RsmH [Candidatus Saccharimonadales bacterium]
MQKKQKITKTKTKMIHQKEEHAGLHTPVLLSQVLAVLQPRAGESYLDLTAGYGGHAEAIVQHTNSPRQTVLVDRDKEAVSALREKFGRSDIEIVHDDFYSASQNLITHGKQFDLILADLGVSSPHLNIASRGFSFRADGPLDMRMNQEQVLSAETIVNTYSQVKLAELIRLYGEDPKANKIADLIVRNRPIKTTNELAAIVARAWPGYHKLHPATRTFQALRISVNDELELLEASLPIWLQLLAPDGRIAIISFHSLEDRIVKRFLQERSGNQYDAVLQLITKRPLSGDPQEIVSNPRARSAKLRAAVKINNKRKGNAHADSG